MSDLETGRKAVIDEVDAIVHGLLDRAKMRSMQVGSNDGYVRDYMAAAVPIACAMVGAGDHIHHHYHTEGHGKWTQVGALAEYTSHEDELYEQKPA